MRFIIPPLFGALFLLGLAIPYVPSRGSGTGTCGPGQTCTPSAVVTTGDVTAGDDLISTDDVQVGDDVLMTDGNKTFYNAGLTMYCGGDGFGTLVCDAPVNIRLDVMTAIYGVATIGQDRVNYISATGATTGIQPSITQEGEAGVGLSVEPPLTIGVLTIDAAGNINTSGGAGFSDTISALGGVDLGGSSDIISESVSCSGSLDFGSIAAGATAELTFTCTGAAVGDATAPIWPTTLEAGLVPSRWLSASNTMRVRLGNITGAPIDPANGQTFAARTFNP